MKERNQERAKERKSLEKVEPNENNPIIVQLFTLWTFYFVPFICFISLFYGNNSMLCLNCQSHYLIWHCYFSINDRFDIPTTGTLYSRSRHVSIILLVTLLSFFVDLFLLETQKANQECCQGYRTFVIAALIRTELEDFAMTSLICRMDLFRKSEQ